MHGDTNKEAQVRRGSLVSLSRSSLTVRCAGVSAFRFPIVGVLSHVAISTAVHMSGMAVWQHRYVQRIMNETDTVDQSVNARGPVDHDSVGLTQAHPN